MTSTFQTLLVNTVVLSFQEKIIWMFLGHRGHVYVLEIQPMVGYSESHFEV